MERKIVMAVSNDNEGVSPLQTIKAIKEAGGDYVFVQWYNKPWEVSQEKQLAYINELGLKVTFAHLGYSTINSLWETTEAGDLLVESLRNDLAICRDKGIPLVIMHLTKTKVAPPPCQLGLERLRMIVDYAKELGMRIAFENTRHREHFDYVLQHITDSNVGICYDAGHCHICFQDDFDFDLYGHRIFEVHLHDNDGLEDQHMLPFDGTIDWPQLMSKLKASGYQEAVTLELCYRNEYLKQPLVDFFKRAYKVADELKRLLNTEE